MSNAELIEHSAAEWLARRDAPGWSETQQQELDAWLTQSVAHRIAYLRLSSVWQRADRLGALRPAAVPAAALPGPASAPRRQWLTRLPLQNFAAGLTMVVALCAVWIGWRGLQDGGEPGDAYSTAVGAHESLTLADGSRLVLNTDTRLRAAVGTSGRTVWLDRGEAYFSIAHDAGRPFVVLVGDRRITVLGTRFSVRRRADQVDVVVEEGRVQVEPQLARAHTAPTVVTRNQAVVSRADNVLVVSKAPAQISNELSWRQGKLVFDQMTLAEAAAEFNRYNRKKLVIDDAALASVRIGGSFDTGNVVGFAALMQQSFGVVVHDTGNEIRISN